MRFKFLFVFLLLSSTSFASCLNDLSQIYEQGREYFSRNQFLLATHQFSSFSLLVCSTEQQYKGRLRWAQSLYELGENVEGDMILKDIPYEATAFKTAKIIQAWYQSDYISSLSKENVLRFQNFSQQLSSFPQVKKPWLAGGLSAILPGAGQFYNGNFQSGVFSFILNAVFLSTTLSFSDHHMDAPAVASGMIFSVVYLGNIANSARGSRRINELHQAERKEKLKERLFPELIP